MALSGIRDMSILEEAPHDRSPVQTYVVEHNPEMLAQAMNAELRRGGQVYYLHNRVESIEHTAAAIKDMLPDAVVGIAHGKMSEDELSEVWRKLLEGEIDILVCTTIIETGVDVPNAWVSPSFIRYAGASDARRAERARISHSDPAGS